MERALSPTRVRRATVADAALLADLAARTFVDSFGHENTIEDTVLHVSLHYRKEIQRRELTDARLTYLIAEAGGDVAGYALIREGATPPCVTGADPVEIQRFYVDRPWQGVGVAQALMTACDAEARRRGRRTIWLGVWERNTRARRFYEKSGFRDVGEHSFLLGNDRQTDRVLARPVPDAATGDR